MTTPHARPVLVSSAVAEAPPLPRSEPGDYAAAGGRIVRNAVALSLARPLTWVSAVGLAVLLPRYLGDVNLGRINIAFAVADWAGLIASFGISTYLTKEVARSRAGAGALVLNALLLRVALAVVIGTLVAVTATLLGYSASARLLLYLIIAHMLLLVVMGVLTGALQGVQQLGVVALVDAISKIVQLGLVAVVLLRGGGPVGVAVAFVASDVFAIGWYLWAVQRRVGLRGPVRLSMWRTILLGGLPFLVWETALLTYARVDVVILAMFAHDAVLGWYGAAYRLISIPLILPSIIMTVVFPALSASARDDAIFNVLARRAIHVVALASIPMAVGLIVLGTELINFLGYPDGFRNTVAPMAILAATLPLVGMNMIVGSALNARDRQRQWALAGVGAAVINVALNLLAIPYTQARFGNGGIGAAAVTSLTEVFLLVAGQVLLPAGVLNRGTWVGVLKCLLAGLVMAAAIWPVRAWPVLVTVPLGAIVYGACSFLLGTLSLQDLRHLRRYLTQRRAGIRVPAERASVGP